jgi:hypothetical protein
MHQKASNSKKAQEPDFDHGVEAWHSDEDAKEKNSESKNIQNYLTDMN